MYEFEKNLLPGETILYKGRPVLGKGEKNVGGLLVFVILCMLAIALLVWSIINKVGDGADIINSIPFFLVAIVMCALGIRQIIYNVFLKDNKIKDEHYCVTNIRVMKYDQNKNKLEFGYIENYDLIFIDNQKGKYGDLCIQKQMPEDLTRESLIENIIHEDTENMKYISFNCIENPNRVKKIIKDAAKNLGKDIEDVIE